MLTNRMVMGIKLSVIICFLILANGSTINAQVGPPDPVGPVPTPSQLAWHEMEMNAFIHFSINTYTDREWGYGDENPALFNPVKANPAQWTKVLKQTGFKGLILTAKHHDGFCLWPSAFTEHSIKNSSYKSGRGDMVKEVSEAVRKDGLKLGIYLSPWDRNRADYGTPTYVAYYRNQLKELFTRYGPIFEMWFDGANGGDGYYGGAREVRRINGATYYDWPTTLKLVRKMSPDILFFSDAGPGVRWVGNENGSAGETNWNTLSTDTLYAGKPGIEKLLNTGSPDGRKWVPAEVDVSIRPGWFYHSREDSLVKTPQQLFDIYLSSVGRGSTLLLNIPPDKNGLFHENDIKSLYGFAELLKKELGHNMAAGAIVSTTQRRGKSLGFRPINLTDGNKNTYWATNNGVTSAELSVDLGRECTVNYILLQEYIKLGQRISSFAIDTWNGTDWEKAAEGTTIGYKRIMKIHPVNTQYIRIRILKAKACLVVSNIEVY